MTAPDDVDRQEAFAKRLTGELLKPGEDGYDDARTVFNDIIDRHPRLIAQCLDTDDVVAAVTYARETNTPLSVKAGGHNTAGMAIVDDGLVIDLSRMNDVTVDPTTRKAYVGGGALVKDLDAATQAHGLAVTTGGSPEVGIGGLTLGGGIGWLMRNCGLTCDNLTAAKVVTADGEVVRASESEHPNLLWGLRGGGGNFGVVTEFEFQLHDIGPEVLTVQIFHPFDVAGEALRVYRDFMADAPDEFTCFPMFVTIPPMEPFPEEHQGETGIAFIGCWSGEVDAGRGALEPLTSWGDPILPIVEPMPYTAFKETSDEGQPGLRYYGKSVYIEELPDDLIDTLVDAIDALPNTFSSVWLESMGGAVARVGPTETAFPHREAAYNVGIGVGWTDPADDEAMMGWAQDIYEMVRPYSTEGIYANYLGQDDDIKDSFGENYDRLVELKTEWDPENVLHMNQNIQPSG